MWTDGIRLVYVSPLKALNYDVERNLRGPLAGITAAADRLGLSRPNLRVGVRTGDTPAAERQAMVRRPPDILITTPESLFLLLTSPTARERLRSVEAIIIDEVHAVAATKRGTHLALSLERLDHLRGSDVQRIALSATQRPLSEIARFVGGDRPVSIVDAGVRRSMEISVVVPIDDMTAPPDGDHEIQLGDAGTRGSIWPSLYPAILEQVRAHRSTLVFVNYRRLAERLALRLNELADAPVARAHHGSLAREARSEIEEALKRGELPCLVATSSLELGIDMGAIDLVIQVESPKSVSRGLQRIGRAGHGVGETSRGTIYPKFRGDLVECAVVVQRMREGLIEETRVPRNPLDVLAQHIVATCATVEWPVSDLAAMVRRSYPYHELGERAFESVLDLLAGRYTSDESVDLRPRIVWDRIEGTVRGRDNARQLAVANAGTIPDRGLYGVFLVDGSGRVGELDEEMVYEARPGQTFHLGASTWRIERITRDRVLVTPAPGRPGQIPFWKGDSVGRPLELGEALGAFVREISAVDEITATDRLLTDHRLDQQAASNLLAYLRDQRDTGGALPDDRTIVVERFRDDVGDWRLCILSPFGGQVHAPWAMALNAVLRESRGEETQALWSDDGIIVHVGDSEDPPDATLALIDPEAVEDLVRRELPGSALYAARFRENAARALLIPRRRPGQRTPLWQQRLKAQSLLAATEGYGTFPIVLETFRECLRDVFDVPGLVGILRRIERREISVVATETAHGSPFAASLLFDYVAQHMYDGDAPPQERRLAALSLDRDLLRELLGDEGLADLLDPDAMAEVELVVRRPLAGGPDGIHDLLRRIGELGEDEIGDPEGIATLLATRRAVWVRIGGESRLIAAEDAGLYRDAVGAMPPDGLPAAYLEPVSNALRTVLRRHARGRGPFAATACAERLAVPLARVLDDLRRLESDGVVVRGSLRPGGGEEWCDAEVLRRIRRATIARLRHEVEAVPAEALGRFLPGWHRIDAPGRGDTDRLRDAISQIQGIALPASQIETEILARRVPGYRPTLLDELCTLGEVVWVGAGDDRVVLMFREDAPLIGQLPIASTALATAVTGAIRERLAAGPCFYPNLVEGLEMGQRELEAALFALIWAGEVTNDAFAPIRTRRAMQTAARAISPAGYADGRRRLRRRSTRPASAVAGRFSLTAPLFAGASEADRARARAELLLERHGVVTRRSLRIEAFAGGFSAVYPELAALETLGIARRGYFVEGLGGAQFALAGAVDRLRDLRGPSLEPRGVALAAIDPANPYGAALPWPEALDGRGSRSVGARVVLVDGELVFHLERGGRTLNPTVDPGSSLVEPAFTALVDTSTGRLSIERVGGRALPESGWAEALARAGFRTSPRGMVLDRRAGTGELSRP